ncbi:hypothetical protein [Streptomyces tendae]|uniref:hypothetical protein n=1 Tax=Streptomyces tendae TaxID=1932 RepID=UPI0037243489
MTAGDGATTDTPLLNTPVLNRTVLFYGEAMSTWTTAALEALIEEATVDAYGEDEQLTGLFTMIEENLAVPFPTTVLGVEVSVVGVDLAEGGRMVARCARGPVRQDIGILDLPLPEPAPEGSQWIEAYRYWAR